MTEYLTEPRDDARATTATSTGLSPFVDEVPDAAHAILVSADGLLMAASRASPASAPSRSPPSPPVWPASRSAPPASSRAARCCRPSSRWRRASCC